jgi:hypothetical protein
MSITTVRRGTAVWFAVCLASLAMARPAAAANRDLPPGIATSLRDAGRPLVTVVAADIDADGDIDVVASDGSLDLLVWVNDGTGQFTRKRPQPVRKRHTESPAGVDEQAPFSDVYTASDSPSIDASTRPSFGDPLVPLALIRGLALPYLQRSRSTLTLRGPPLHASLN